MNPGFSHNLSVLPLATLPAAPLARLERRLFLFMSKLTIEIRETYMRSHKRYGPVKFLADIFLVCVTGGFWLIWIFVREMRRH